jgi:hypothetical protein
MSLIIRLALALDLLAIWCEHIVPKTKAFLPIGGDHFTQVAAMVLIAAILGEILEILNSSKSRK